MKIAGTFLVAWVMASASVVFAEIKYNVVDLGTLGGPSSHANDINDNGQVTGISDTSSFISHGFIDDGMMHDLGPLGAQSINASGTVSGSIFSTATGNYLAATYHGTTTPLPTLGGPSSRGYSINDAGAVTGQADTQFFGSHAFIYDGSMHDLGTFGSATSVGNSIKQIVTGLAYLFGNAEYHAYLYEGVQHDLGTLGGKNSDGFDINDVGPMTGYFYFGTETSLAHAFLYGGAMHDLGSLGGDNSDGFGINNHGYIVGVSQLVPGGVFHAILYTSAAGRVDLNSLIDPSAGWVLTAGKSINDSG